MYTKLSNRKINAEIAYLKGSIRSIQQTLEAPHRYPQKWAMNYLKIKKRKLEVRKAKLNKLIKEKQRRSEVKEVVSSETSLLFQIAEILYPECKDEIQELVIKENIDI